MNILGHLIFAGLYAFEHNNQVLLFNEAISADNNPLGNTRIEAEGAVEVVYTPVGNVVIMVLNILLVMLTLQITVNIDDQVEHIQAPTFMQQRI